MATCNVPDCSRPVRARGPCAAHYERDSDEQLPAELNRIMRRLLMPAEEAPR